MEWSAELYNSYLEVNLKTLCANYQKAKEAIGESTGIIPVLKANAYNLGDVEVANALIKQCQVEIIAVAHVTEALRLREQGIKIQILVLGAVPLTAIKEIVKYNIQLSVYTQEIIELLAKESVSQNKKTAVQIAINSGLNRLGVRPGKSLTLVLDMLTKYKNMLEVTGVYTHLATGQEYNSPFAKEQYRIFQEAYKQVLNAGFTPRYEHICDSGASDWFREAYKTHVRLARRLYMRHMETDKHFAEKYIPKEPASWRAPILSIIKIQAGESIGYDRVFIAQKPMRVAIIGVGYGDGMYPTMVGQKNIVLVGDTLSGYIGMCMDQSFIDVTDIPCKVGDEATLFGYSKNGTYLSVEEVGKKAGKDGCYMLSFLTNRVKRIYI